MKRLSLLTALAVVASSCHTMGVEPSYPHKNFTFHVKGDFTTNYEDMTKADATRLENGNTAGLTDLWVLDYDYEGTLLQQVHQVSTQADFGTVSMPLQYGHHDIKFIASKGSGAVLTDDLISWSKVHDTYALDYAVDVQASTNGNRAPELKRVISGLKIVIADKIPDNAKTIRLTLGSRSQSLTLPELSALPYSESSVDLDCTSNRGVKNAAVAIYSLAGDEEWESTASIEVLTESGTSLSKVDIPSVTLKRNRLTILTGEVFNRSSAFQVGVLDDWENPEEGEF